MPDSASKSPIIDFYRCPETLIPRVEVKPTAAGRGYFKFGDDAVCYGASTATPSESPSDVYPNAEVAANLLRLPFDPADVLDNLRQERYAANGYMGKRPILTSRPLMQAYYGVRPLLPVAVRKHAQRFALKGWQQVSFPRWPVDNTVGVVLDRLLRLSMQAMGVDEMPFVWFWPDGAEICLLMTHDVETPEGMAYVERLMDIDDSFGLKASFQLIPEKQYSISDEAVRSIKNRGYEVNIQDLRHDCNLFDDRDKFLERARAINRYAERYQAVGFRAGRLYRNPAWFGALNMEYDMSVPNAAHLEPQRGGCCTVFPYFIGNLLEMPLTTTQDYTLFHVLGERSIELWKKQIAQLSQYHGLISFIVHPDYIQDEPYLSVYKDLLAYLTELRAPEKIWCPVPGEVNRWWRARSRMTLEKDGGRWTVTGPGSERARVAYARVAGDRLIYETTSN